MPRPYVRTTILYTTALIVGTTLAVTATLSGTRLDMFVAFAVLLVVGAALAAGMGPALVVAITSVIGDDVLLTGRLSGVEHWEHLIAFGGVAIAIGWLVGDRRRRQLEAEQAVRREQELREERASILAAVSHDVKSPLAVILGTAKQGLSVAGSATVERLFTRIDAAGQQAHRLLETLDDLRSFDGQTMDLRMECRDLRQTVTAAVEQLQTLSARHELTVASVPAPIVARYDEARLQRVLANVIGNAIKYSPDGGRVEVQIGASGSEAWISVRDEGVGIPRQERGRVFDRGYRATTVGPIAGTGLGLFISAEIVKRHGGRMECEDAPGRGTIFRVHLPRISDAMVVTTRALQREMPPAASQ